jgi:hypothetical protein
LGENMINISALLFPSSVTYCKKAGGGGGDGRMLETKIYRPETKTDRPETETYRPETEKRDIQPETGTHTYCI